MDKKFSIKILCGHKCNACCSYCDVPKDEDEDFYQFSAVEQVYEIIKDFPELCMELDGGEVFCYPEIIEWALKFNIPLYIFTNGTLITQTAIKNFHDKVILRISLDGIESIHNQQKILQNKENSFEQTMKGIELLKRNNITFMFGTTITEKTIPKLNECKDFLLSLEPQRIIFTTQMFPKEEDKIKTKEIWEKSYPIMKEWNNPKISFNSFHKENNSKNSEKLIKNIEILFKKEIIQLNIAGFSTPTLRAFKYDELDKLLKEIFSLCNS